MRTLPREVRWYPDTPIHRARLPASVRGWLLDDGSLTAHIRARCPGRFRLNVLRERRGLPLANEAAALGISGQARARIREVALCCGETRLVLARSVIPNDTMRGSGQRLAGLGKRPLGALLFADRSMRREAFQFARLTPAQAGLPPGLVPGRAVWGRRAVFRIGGAPLLVAEFFLPALVEPALADCIGSETE